MTDAEAMLDRLGEHAHRMLLVRQEPCLNPFYHLVVPSGPDLLVSCPWRNENEKIAYIAALRKLAHEKGAVAFGCIAEVWMTTYASRELPDPLPRPSQSERRVEAVMASYRHGDGRVYTRHWLIERDDTGAICELRLGEDYDEGGKFEGRMLDDILPSGDAP